MVEKPALRSDGRTVQPTQTRARPKGCGGFSLVETLITAAVVSIIALAVATLISHLSGAIATLSLGANVVALQRDLQLAISSPGICQKTLIAPSALPAFNFDPVAAAGSTASLGGQDVKVQLLGGNVIVEGGAVVVGYKVKVNWLKLADAVLWYTDAAGNKTYSAKMNLYPSGVTDGGVSGTGQQSLALRTIGDLFITIDPAGNALGCYAGQPKPKPARLNCAKFSWGSKGEGGSFMQQWAGQGDTIPSFYANNEWAVCPPGHYLVGVRGTGISTGSKKDFGEILCCEF